MIIVFFKFKKTNYELFSIIINNIINKIITTRKKAKKTGSKVTRSTSKFLNVAMLSRCRSSS